MKYSIRIAAEEDNNTILSLFKKTSLGLNKQVQSRETFPFDGNIVRIFLADIGRESVGIISARHAEGFGLITKLGVLPEYQRQGIASALMEEALVWLKNHGVNSTFIMVLDDNEDADQFYNSQNCNLRPLKVYRKDI